jgi:hypothetical protein
MWVELSGGQTIGVPYAWFPQLLNATPKQRKAVEVDCFGLDGGAAGQLNRARRKPLKRWRKSERIDNFFHKNGIRAILFLGRRIEPAPREACGGEQDRECV